MTPAVRVVGLAWMTSRLPQIVRVGEGQGRRHAESVLAPQSGKQRGSESVMPLTYILLM